jgi:hypothetical protein
MATTIFDFVAEKLEQATDFDKLEARGTIRLSLKQAGLEAKAVDREQMTVVVTKVLPAELKARGVAQSESICESLAQAVKSFEGAEAVADDRSPEAVFKRIGGG